MTDGFDPRTSLHGLYPPLTEEQAKKVADLQRRVASLPAPRDYQDALREQPTLLLSKFLYARKWISEDAFDMFRTAAAWRLHHRLGGDVPVFPAMRPPRGYDVEKLIAAQGGKVRPQNQSVDMTEAAYSDISPSRWHYWDKGGRPILIERTGMVDTEALVERTRVLTRPGEKFTKRYCEYDRNNNEIGNALVDYANKYLRKDDNAISQCTVIMDLKHITLRHFSTAAMELVTASTDMAQRYYPEGLHKVYAVNAPAVAKVGFRLLVPFLDKRVQEKVVFTKNAEETRRVLLQAVDADKLPKFLGGTCECTGGCVPVKGEGGAPDRWSSIDKRHLTHTRHVGAGRSSHVEFDVTDEAGPLHWSFEVDSKRTVDYVVSLADSSGSNGKALVLAPPTRGVFAEGVVSVPSDYRCSAAQPCKLRVDLDNSFSWVNAKDVRWRVEPVAVREAAAREAAAAVDSRYPNPAMID
jgi:hypothetical protein